MDILRIFELPDLTNLREESGRDGFNFLERLVNDFKNGSNRFSKPGEALFAAFQSQNCIGIGGVNQGPQRQHRYARVRRVYISHSHRGQGVGRQLMQILEDWSRPHFDYLVLNTDTEVAATTNHWITIQ